MRYARGFNRRVPDTRRNVAVLFTSALGLGMLGGYSGISMATTAQYFYTPISTVDVYTNPCANPSIPSGSTACMSGDPTSPATFQAVDWAQLKINNYTYTYPYATDAKGNGSFIAAPDAAPLKRQLVVILGGSLSSPLGYQTIAERAAYNGFPVIDLQWDDDYFPNDACPAPSSATLKDPTQGPQAQATQDRCLTELRGASAFGVQSSYAGTTGQVPVYCPTGSLPCTQAAYSLSTGVTNQYNTPTTDSIANRLVTALDQLANQQPANSNSPNVLGITTNGTWGQYLVPANNSPYRRMDGTGTYPDWSNIILVGHSLGGGAALFIAKHLPVQRTIVISSPEDDVPALPTTAPCPEAGIPADTQYTSAGVCTAAWISNSNYTTSGGQANPQWPASYTGTPVSAIWGLRHGLDVSSSDESPYGQEVEFNWKAIPGFEPTPDDLLTDDGYCVVTPTCIPSTPPDPRRYVLAHPAWGALSSLYNHDSTAVDPQPYVSYPSPAVAYIWDRMLTH